MAGMFAGRKWVFFGCAASLLAMRCVGDSSVPDAGGNDATSDVVVVDTGTDVQSTDAGQDADASGSKKHVFATSFNGALLVYDQPLSNGSQPTTVVTANFQNPADVEFLPGNAQIIVTDPGAK